MKKRKGDDWFPFWIDKWLLGSTRDELTVEQCAVWVDFLALSYKDEGYIRANEGMPYSVKRLSGILNRSEELIQSTIDRCLEKKINKLKREKNGTLYVISHPEYELSKRHKRRLTGEDVRKNGHDVQKKDAKRREEKIRLEKIRKEKIKRDARLKKEKEELEKEFTQFWNLYNYKVSQGDALKAFKVIRRKDVSLERILKCVKGYQNFVKSKRVHNGFDQKIKYPAGFLRNDYLFDYEDIKYKPPL